ncbi:MAG TPA: PAS domain-containing sensor histidine kinase [Candidatus Aminicenantes bacterium]|nr:PAS domain-containing sensor histidine kinase [Candidatus Aminicenantes bacterium]
MKTGIWTQDPLTERIFSSLHILIAWLDPDFNFVRVNDAYARAVGRDPAFFVGRNHFVLYPNEENEGIFREVVATGKPYTALAKPFEYPDEPEIGVTYWDWSLQPLKDADGRMEGLILCLIDVTSRETALQESSRLASAIENAREGVLILDTKGVVRYANAAFVRRLGSTKADLIGHEYRGVLFDRDGETLASILGESIRKGAAWTGQYRRSSDKDSPADRAITIYPITDGGNAVSGYAVIERDITEELRLRKQVEQKNKMEALGTLAGGVAHDFNNILMPVLVNIELALMDIPRESPAAGHLRLSLEAAERGAELVREIISFSRPASQEKTVIRIAPVVREALRFLKSTLPSHIKILQQVRSDTGAVLANRSQIYQVLVNLCTNAADAMGPGGGRLKVRLENASRAWDGVEKGRDRRRRRHVKLTVSDTGGGMNEAVLDRIFEPFFSTKDKSRRAGMGLAVVHGIVRAHGGFIRVRSVEGEGTVFEVFLPRAEAPPRAGPKAEGRPAGGRERILLVDDDAAVLQSVGKVLSRRGYDVVMQSDGREALRAFLASPESFDLAMTDQIMPEISGLELARSLRAARPGMPIILCVGHHEAVDRRVLEKLGLREIALKPLNTRMIARTVRRVLDEAVKA